MYGQFAVPLSDPSHVGSLGNPQALATMLVVAGSLSRPDPPKARSTLVGPSRRCEFWFLFRSWSFRACSEKRLPGER